MGVPSVAQWVKNPPAVAWVTPVVQSQSPAWPNGLKDPVLPQLQSLAPELPYAAGAAILKKILYIEDKLYSKQML